MRHITFIGLADDDNPELLDEQLYFATDKKPFSTLGYTNGPGGYSHGTATVRPNITSTNTGKLLLDFSLTVKAATLIFISGCGLAISSAKEGKSGFIYNLVKSK